MTALPESLPRDFGPAERIALETAVYNALKYWEKAKELSAHGDAVDSRTETADDDDSGHRHAWPDRPPVPEVHTCC